MCQAHGNMQKLAFPWDDTPTGPWRAPSPCQIGSPTGPMMDRLWGSGMEWKEDGDFVIINICCAVLGTSISQRETCLAVTQPRLKPSEDLARISHFLIPPRPFRWGLPGSKTLNWARPTRLSVSPVVLTLRNKEICLCFKVFKRLRWRRCQSREILKEHKDRYPKGRRGRGGLLASRMSRFQWRWGWKSMNTGGISETKRDGKLSALIFSSFGWKLGEKRIPLGLNCIMQIFLGRPCFIFVSKEVTKINLHFKITWQGHL